MNSSSGRYNEQVGDSIYQKESNAYYDTLREIHNSIFITPQRMKAEKTEERYSNGNVPGIENLYTFINILVDLLKHTKNVTGVDYGCGSHYFIDDMYRNHQWNVIGFDADKSAIDQAWRKFPESAGQYRALDLLRNQMPLPDQSRDFVFCNAVIQHFSDDEVKNAFEDIGRILKHGGVFLIIFKRKADDFTLFAKESGLEINILDESAGMVEIEDRTMKKAMDALNPEKKSSYPPKFQRGMRLFHFFSVAEIENAAKSVNLTIIDKIIMNNGIQTKGIFTYDSGKGIPAAALFFRKE